MHTNTHTRTLTHTHTHTQPICDMAWYVEVNTNSLLQNMRTFSVSLFVMILQARGARGVGGGTTTKYDILCASRISKVGNTTLKTGTYY